MTSPAFKLDPAKPRFAGDRKIRLIINHEHVANVLRVRRELCVGESVSGTHWRRGR